MMSLGFISRLAFAVAIYPYSVIITGFLHVLVLTKHNLFINKSILILSPNESISYTIYYQVY